MLRWRMAKRKRVENHYTRLCGPRRSRSIVVLWTAMNNKELEAFYH